MERARRFILARGGIGATRIFTKLWLSLFGQFDWQAMPAMPPEAMLLPLRSPIHVYAFASWARATIVPILVVWAHKPVVSLPDGASVDELYVDGEDRWRVRYRHDRSPLSARNAFIALDALLKWHERSPWKPLRSRSLRRCERWIVEHQEADGSWGGIQPPWVYSLIALRCLGYPNEHPVMAKGIRGLLEDFGLESPDTFTVQPCVSPVWDTALAVIGLREAGVPARDLGLVRAGQWLLDREVRTAGDWAKKAPGIEPGGWAFEFANEQYPDTDDTAEVLMALRLLDLGNAAAAPAARAKRWLRHMQSANGGWGAFDKDNTNTLVTKIPFCDFGATIDPPSEDVTAHIVEMFALEGADHVPPLAATSQPVLDDGMMRRAVDYLLNAQEDDGAWFGRWGVNYVYGIGAVVPALVAAAVNPHDSRIVRAARWLTQRQNADGGWGESCVSYDDPSLRGRGESTASQTAWALLALIAADEAQSEAVRRGIAYLVATQRPDGQWEEPQFTGTGFPRDFMLKYHLYRNYWPLWALGRYRRVVRGTPVHMPGSDPLS
jgi:squalene-hopene/tetraprenyl-beta-curcumene cyclase